jgi:hypothetical protein
MQVGIGLPEHWYLVHRHHEEEFFDDIWGQISDISDPLPSKLVFEVGDSDVTCKGSSLWHVDLRIYDDFYCTERGGVYSGYKEAEIGPSSIEELPYTLLNCKAIRSRLGDERCAKELQRREDYNRAEHTRKGIEYESMRQRKILNNERKLMELGLDCQPPVSDEEHSECESQEYSGDDDDDCSSSTEGEDSGVHFEVPASEAALVDPLVLLGKRARHRHRLAEDLSTLECCDGRNGGLERGVHVYQRDSESDEDFDDVVGPMTRAAKRHNKRMASASASGRSSAFAHCYGRNLPATNEVSSAEDEDKDRGSDDQSEEEAEEVVSANRDAARQQVGEKEKLEYPKPSSYLPNALSDDSDEASENSGRNNDDGEEEEEDEQRWAADYLRDSRSSVGDEKLANETELDSIRIRGASTMSLGELGWVFSLAYNRAVDLLSSHEEKNIGGEYVMVTNFPAAVYVQVPSSMQRVEFIQRLLDHLMFEHKFMKAPNSYFFSSRWGNDKKVCQVSSVPRNVSCTALRRALQSLGVSTYDLAMHGTSLKVKDFDAYPWLKTDFTAGLDVLQKQSFGITVDFSITHRFPGLWGVRGPSEFGCKTFYEEADISQGYGSVRVNAMVQNKEGQRVMHFEIQEAKRLDYPTLYSKKRITGVNRLTFYSQLQHERKGVVSTNTEWGSYGSTIAGCLARVKTMEEAILRIEECDKVHCQLAAGGSEPVLKYSEGIRSEVQVVFNQPLSLDRVLARARESVELRYYVMCELLGWQRRKLERTLERGREMCRALKAMLTGQSNSAATVEHRHGIAVLYNVLGHSAGSTMGFAFRKPSERQVERGEGMDERDQCALPKPWHEVAWYVRQGNIAKRITHKTKDQTLLEIRRMCFFCDRRPLGDELGGARICWKQKGRDLWNDRGQIWFASKSLAADEIYRRYRKAWRKHVSLKPGERSWASKREREEKRELDRLGRLYDARPANLVGFKSLHQLKEAGDEWVKKAGKGGGRKKKNQGRKKKRGVSDISDTSASE